MKTKLFLGLLFLAAGCASFGADGLGENLQKGLFEEEANRDLEAAIQAYQAVIAQADEQRKIAATAVFRLGECYRKLGRTNDATTQYQRILSAYSDQAQLLTLSQQNLAALGGSSRQTAGPPGSEPATDEETKEIQRLQALLNNSPDLINVSDINRLQVRRTPLHNAAFKGQLAVAQFLLANRVEVNAVDSTGQTPLHLAAFNGHKTMVEVLLANGADVNAKEAVTSQRSSDAWGNTPLHESVQRGFKAVTEVLLKHGANPNATNQLGMAPLHVAAVNGYLPLAELLLKEGAQVNLKAKDGGTPLHLAGNKTEMIKLLLDYKAEINAQNEQGRTPLLAAFASGVTPEIVALLLKNGAEVNISSHGSIPRTPLAAAVRNGATEIVKLLLDYKPDLEANEAGLTPLQIAVSQAHAPVAELLLAAGANPNVTAALSGETPLHWAVQKQNKRLVELLLTFEADPNAPDNNGNTPLVLMQQLSRAPTPVALAPGAPRPPAVPPRPGIPFQRRDQEIEAPGLEIGALLRKFGANENLRRLKGIFVSRSNFTNEILFRGTQDYNRYTLLELIAVRYSYSYISPQLPFPDFTAVQVSRIDPSTGQASELKVNVEQILSSGACTNDILLEWGDIVEIPETVHILNESWPGFPREIVENWNQCLTRTVIVYMGSQTTKLTLKPIVPHTSSGSNILSFRDNSMDLHLNHVLRGTGVLRTNSDLSRVKVKRTDPATQKPIELMINLEQKPDSRTDLWLRAGDVIEVPEKP